MEQAEGSSSSAGGTFSKLICDEDHDTDENPPYANQETQQVSMSMPRPASHRNHYKQLAVSLAVLALILLAIDIGLGVYYSRLTGYRTITDIGKEVDRLQASYNAAIRSRDEVKQQLQREISEQQRIKWELEHQTRRYKDYEKQIDKLQTKIAGIKSHIPMLKEGCRHCSPGWIYMNSACYFFAFSDALSRRSWSEARQFCKQQGADLAIINTAEKTMAVTSLINSDDDPARPRHYSGFWIGLTDVDVEGTWKWLDGKRVTEGYWNDGEPNNVGEEDCAATYPRYNPFKAWNDAPCSYSLKWICEMEPASAI